MKERNTMDLIWFDLIFVSYIYWEESLIKFLRWTVSPLNPISFRHVYCEQRMYTEAKQSSLLFYGLGLGLGLGLGKESCKCKRSLNFTAIFTFYFFLFSVSDFLGMGMGSDEPEDWLNLLIEISEPIYRIGRTHKNRTKPDQPNNIKLNN